MGSLLQDRTQKQWWEFFSTWTLKDDSGGNICQVAGYNEKEQRDIARRPNMRSWMNGARSPDIVHEWPQESINLKTFSMGNKAAEIKCEPATVQSWEGDSVSGAGSQTQHKCENKLSWSHIPSSSMWYMLAPHQSVKSQIQSVTKWQQGKVGFPGGHVQKLKGGVTRRSNPDTSCFQGPYWL